MPARGVRHLRLDDPAVWRQSPGRSADVSMVTLPLGPGDSDPVAFVFEYVPGAVVPAHHHATDYVSVVLEGEMTVSGRTEARGDVRIVSAGTVYGPLRVGPRGCRVLELFRSREDLPPRYVGTGPKPNVEQAQASIAEVIASALSAFGGVQATRDARGDRD